MIKISKFTSFWFNFSYTNLLLFISIRKRNVIIKTFKKQKASVYSVTFTCLRTLRWEAIHQSNRQMAPLHPWISKIDALSFAVCQTEDTTDLILFCHLFKARFFLSAVECCSEYWSTKTDLFLLLLFLLCASFPVCSWLSVERRGGGRIFIISQPPPAYLAHLPLSKAVERRGEPQTDRGT